MAELSDDYTPDSFVESMLEAIVKVLEEHSGDDVFGTEGWEYFFGYED